MLKTNVKITTTVYHVFKFEVMVEFECVSFVTVTKKLTSKALFNNFIYKNKKEQFLRYLRLKSFELIFFFQKGPHKFVAYLY